MNPVPSGDEELHVVPRDTEPARLRQSATNENSQPDLEIPPASSSQPVSRSGGLTFVASVLLIAIAFTVGLSYLLEKRWVHRRAALTNTESTDNNSQPGPTAAGPLHRDMFHVSSVSLGSSRLAIVNGKSVTEGESIVVVTPSGPIAVQVAKITDGRVRFVSGREQIEVAVSSPLAEKNSP